MTVRYSLLDVVQHVLSSMDSDEVNSYADTTESLQVASCAEIIYNDLITTADLPEQYRLFSLTASDSLSLPIVMYRPSDCESIEWIKYKSTDEEGDQLHWRVLTPITIEEYLARQDGLNEDDSTVNEMNLTLADTTL